MGNMFGATGPTAPYPSVGYPAEAFFGGANLQPGTNKGAADSPTVNPAEQKKMLITLGVLIGGGYLVWHLYNR